MEQQILAQLPAQKKGDLLRVLLQARILKMYMEELLVDSPDPIKNGGTRVTREIVELERKILNHTDEQFPWLRKELDKDKLWDIASIADLMTRINVEEKEEVYEEFMGMLVKCINTIFYAQKNRKNIYFGKYRALFKLFTDELTADVNQQPSQFWFRNRDGLLFFRANPVPEQPQELKP